MTSTLTRLLSLENLALLAGLLHFCQMPALFFAPKMLHWREEFAGLSPINRRIFQMIGIALLWMTQGLGVLVVIAHKEMVNGCLLGKSLCFYLGLVWGFRAFVQVFVYWKLWPGGWLGILSNYGLTVLLFFLTGLYFFLFVMGFYV
jgi:hypothetical protein